MKATLMKTEREGRHALLLSYVPNLGTSVSHASRRRIAVVFFCLVFLGPSVGVMVSFSFSGSLSRWLRVVFRFPRLQLSSGKALLLTSGRRCRRSGAVVP